MLELSTDQQIALGDLQQVIEHGHIREAVLRGPAGSGKTSLLRILLANMRAIGMPAVLVAPTGKAAARVQALTKQPAHTIHSLLYKRVEELARGDLVFSGLRALTTGRSLVVCDEASMVTQDLRTDMLTKLPPSACILWVGDQYQLPPIERYDSFAGWSVLTMSHAACADLTTVHRQETGSAVLDLAQGLLRGDALRPSRSTGEAAARYTADMLKQGKDCTLLTYTNHQRHKLNEQTRAYLGYSDAVVPGDVLVCTRTNKDCGLLNGETRTVAEVRPGTADTTLVRWTDGNYAKILPDLLATGCPYAANGQSLWPKRLKKHGEDLLQAEYGYCLTIHKAQGSQWDTVNFVLDDGLQSLRKTDPKLYQQLCYTAVTRAVQEVNLFTGGR